MPLRPNLGLRARLALILLPCMLFLLLASAAAQYLLAVRPLEHQLDRSLADVAIALADRLEVSESGEVSFNLSDEAAELLDADALDDNWFTAFNDSFQPIAGEPDLHWPPVTIARREPYFFNTIVDGVPVRAVAVKTHCGALECGVINASTLNKRTALVEAVQVSALLPVVLAGVVSMALLWFGLDSGLKPLLRLSAELARRSPRELSPVRGDDVPAEVQPLMEAVNRLMLQLADAGAAQQRFLATAAHQLRTPLAGLQSRIELAQIETADPEARAQLGEIHESAVRASRLAVQLLSLARVEPGASMTDERIRLDFAQLARDLVDEWVRRAIARGTDLGFDLAPAPVVGSPLLLRELMVNLLHNALEYTPAGGHVTLRCGVLAGESYLEVEDDGPGIPLSLRNVVLERFMRLPGTPGAGSGLGLAIVQEIAQAHQGRLALLDGSAGRGLRVRLSLASAGPPD